MDTEQLNGKSFWFSVIVFFFLIVARISLIRDEDIVSGMAVLSVLALDYVIVAIGYNAFVNVQKKLKSSFFPSLVVKRKINAMFISLLIVSIVICGFEFIYIRFFSRALVNDILSIIALFMSMEDRVLSKLSMKIMEKVVKI